LNTLGILTEEGFVEEEAAGLDGVAVDAAGLEAAEGVEVEVAVAVVGLEATDVVEAAGLDVEVVVDTAGLANEEVAAGLEAAVVGDEVAAGLDVVEVVALALFCSS